MASDRFAQKRAEQRQRTLTRVGIAIGLVVAVVAGVWIAWFSTWFAADKVAVSGTTSLDEAAVARVAQVPMGEPLLRIDTRAVAKRVAKLPQVESVEVSRGWSDVIEIKVTERVAVAWLTKDKKPWAVDITGAIFRELEAKPDDLPELRVDRFDMRSLGAAAGVAGDLRADGRALLDEVLVIEADTKDSVALQLADDTRIVWGSRADTAAKVRVLRPLREIEATVYDVAAPDNPTTSS